MGLIRKLATVFSLVAFNGLSHAAVAASPEIFYDNSLGSPIFPLIQSAKNSIDIEIYEMSDLQVQSALIDALDRGVKLRIVQESKTVGTKCRLFEMEQPQDSADCLEKKKFIQKVRSKGGSYVPYPYQQLCTQQCLEHGKLVLVDRQKAMLSTGNFNATNLCNPGGLPKTDPLKRCNRDFSVVSTDADVILTFSTVFEADFRGTAYDLSKIVKADAAKRVTVSPYSMDPIVQFIQSAKKSIMIENQYLKDPDMNYELVSAAKRGVKVSVILSSACAFGKLDPKRDAGTIRKWTDTFMMFDQAGIQSRIFTKNIKVNGFDGYLHSKTILVDGVRAWVGSVNGSTQALTKNREFGIFMDDATEVSKLMKVMSDDLNHPNSESWQESLNCAKD